MIPHDVKEWALGLRPKECSRKTVGTDPVDLTPEFSETDSAPYTDEILLVFRASCYLCFAGNESEAATKLASDASRRLILDGETESYYRYPGDKHVWAISSDGNTGTVDREEYMTR